MKLAVALSVLAVNALPLDNEARELPGLLGELASDGEGALAAGTSALNNALEGGAGVLGTGLNDVIQDLGDGAGVLAGELNDGTQQIEAAVSGVAQDIGNGIAGVTSIANNIASQVKAAATQGAGALLGGIGDGVSAGEAVALEFEKAASQAVAAFTSFVEANPTQIYDQFTSEVNLFVSAGEATAEAVASAIALAINNPLPVTFADAVIGGINAVKAVLESLGSVILTGNPTAIFNAFEADVSSAIAAGAASAEAVAGAIEGAAGAAQLQFNSVVNGKATQGATAVVAAATGLANALPAISG